jgi:ribose 5-phosphate isomerase B
MKIAIGSDHRGFALKQFLMQQSYTPTLSFIDVGCSGSDSVDYNDYATAVARAIKNGSADYGVLICNSGVGITMAANRYPWVRAALCHNKELVQQTRQHNDANVLAMGTAVVTPAQAAEMLQTFVTTPFEGGRHQGRVDKLTNPDDLGK